MDNFILEARLGFMVSGGLDGQFGAESFEFALGGPEPAALIFGDIGFEVRHLNPPVAGLDTLACC